jgi:hypothetical protein
MSYKKKTPYLGIPVVGNGDRIMPDIEMRKYTIIENMLIAGTQGLTEVVFDDGDYHLDKVGETYSVNVRAGGTYPSIHGMVGGFYFRAPPKVIWEGLKPDCFYYLYVKATPNTPHERTSIRVTASRYPLGKGSLLVATADLRGEAPKIDAEPDGKVYSQDVARHASDDSNPHGRQLIQDELTIAKVLELGEGAQIKVAGSLIPIDTFAETVASLGGRRTERIDFNSGGPEGIVLRASGKVFSVQVHERGKPGIVDLAVGDVGIGYFGEDETADEECEFVVYNNGAEGVPMRALVVCG